MQIRSTCTRMVYTKLSTTCLDDLQSNKEPILEVVNDMCWSPSTTSSSCNVSEQEVLVTVTASSLVQAF